MIYAVPQTCRRACPGRWREHAPAVAIDGKRCFVAFLDSKAAHVLNAFAADGQTILGHLSIAEKRSAMIEALGLTGRLLRCRLPRNRLGRRHPRPFGHRECPGMMTLKIPGVAMGER